MQKIAINDIADFDQLHKLPTNPVSFVETSITGSDNDVAFHVLEFG